MDTDMAMDTDMGTDTNMDTDMDMCGNVAMSICVWNEKTNMELYMC